MSPYGLVAWIWLGMMGAAIMAPLILAFPLMVVGTCLIAGVVLKGEKK